MNVNCHALLKGTPTLLTVASPTTSPSLIIEMSMLVAMSLDGG